MGKKEKILRPVKKIGRGLKLPHLKNTAEMKTVVFNPKTVSIPLIQHIGAPCEPTVKKGDSVFVGTLIGESTAFVSSPVYSSVSGSVTDVKTISYNGKDTVFVVIESDGKFEKDAALAPCPVKNQEELAAATKKCGLVGLGGAGFPTHIKLSPPKDTKIDTLIINAAECEPYITSDYRECIEGYDDIIDGVYLIKDILGVERVVICVEDNKPEAIKKLYEIATNKRDNDDTVKLMELPASYPQGAEKVIIYSATGRKLPLGKLPSDVGCIVMNVTTIATLYRFIKTGVPLVSKRITLEGTAVNNPQNILAPIGTKISDIIEFAGGVSNNADRIIMGGPMMGAPIATADAVIEKRTNAVLILNEETPAESTPCIRCGRCANTCPMRLMPLKVEAALRILDTATLEDLNVNYCMECGSCSFACPAKRPLTQVMRIAKQTLRRESK